MILRIKKITISFWRFNMAEERVIRSEVVLVATAALNQSVTEDLKQEDRPMAEILKKDEDENS